MNSTKSKAALQSGALLTAQALVILLGLWVALQLLGSLWSVVWPLVVALLLTTLTWPAARFLRHHGWNPTVAAATVTLASLLVVAVVLVGIAVPVASQSPQLVAGVVQGIQQARQWASGPPLNIGHDQITQVLDAAAARLQNNVGAVINSALSGVGTIFNGVLTAVLAIFLMFFFLKDGPKFLPWLARQLPGRLTDDIPVIATRGWDTLSAFVRAQAFVGMLDAVCVGIGLWIVGVPLVLPLAALTFVTAFVPIVGAVFAGLVAIAIALVFNGPGDALIVLVIILAVQQLEGNVFSPMIQSRGIGLHPAVILLAVTLGSGLAGIVGSLLAVPVAGFIAVVWGYLREQLSDPAPQPDHDADPSPTPPA